ncbi:aminoglycoside phosphotransferase family protein [Streptomyces sp. TRM 70361]|uniref:aminoglycoside phosphotransferase family protein n=1 Tax=Streptomyces sp. TRM 70361 TaxID=3116553 RepID=UPI002E7BF51A|nr:aminoglycoside phosphotransferase family protein [Streptomyces sp. TRM 70361]MEE1941792.1 aminoglycoside phosphotransferase family protein [Streptomyces sp. TRM 70361]
MASAPHLEPPQRLVRALGADSPWLAALPSLARDALARWELTAERVVAPGGRGSLVVLVRRADGTPAALKLRAAGAGAEAAALARWDGHGAVRLLEAAPEADALLLERLHAEVSLRSLPEAKANLEAVSALRRLWVPPEAGSAPPVPPPFTTVERHTGRAVDRIRRHTPPQARSLAEEALAVRSGLLADAPENLLLHGDFRQGAVLSAAPGRAHWLAAGPDPLVGERAYDLARLVRDRLHDLMAGSGGAARTRRRIAKLADSLEVDRDRLRGWSLYRAVESGTRQLAAGDRADGELLLEFASWLRD